MKQHLDMLSSPAASECQADQQLRNAKRPRVLEGKARPKHLDGQEDMEEEEEAEVEEEEEKLLPFPWQKNGNCEYSNWYYYCKRFFFSYNVSTCLLRVRMSCYDFSLTQVLRPG